MAEPNKTFGQFMIGLFCESDGTPSYARVISFLATLFVMVLSIVQYIRTGQPPAALDLLQELLGAAAPYGVNRVSKMFPAAGAKVGSSG